MGSHVVTFVNNTKEAIYFLHEFKNVEGPTFFLEPGGNPVEQSVTTSQTNERYQLLDSREKKTGKYVYTEDLQGFNRVTVIKLETGEFDFNLDNHPM